MSGTGCFEHVGFVADLAVLAFDGVVGGVLAVEGGDALVVEL